MLFMIRFTDKPNTQDIRAAHVDAHLAWLAERKDTILIAGPLRHDPEGAPLGAMWIVDVPGKSEAEALFETDPFWVNSMRASVEILHWAKVFPKEAATVA